MYVCIYIYIYTHTHTRAYTPTQVSLTEYNSGIIHKLPFGVNTTIKLKRLLHATQAHSSVKIYPANFNTLYQRVIMLRSQL